VVQAKWRENKSRHKEYEYFVNVIDVAQDIKQSVPLGINYSFLISVYI